MKHEAIFFMERALKMMLYLFMLNSFGVGLSGGQVQK